MTKVYENCTVYVTELNDGTFDISWKRNYPIPDDESKDALAIEKVREKALNNFE